MTPVKQEEREETDRLPIEFFRSTKASSNSAFRSVKDSTLSKTAMHSQSVSQPVGPSVS